MHGVTQGSVLTSMLFLLYINDLPNRLKSSKSILYSDNTNLYNSIKEVKCLCDTLSFELSAVVKWLNLIFLFLNFSNTKFVVFTNKYISDTLNIIYEDKLFLRSESALFLGSEVDNKLTFGNHISKLYKKVCKIQGVLFKL